MERCSYSSNYASAHARSSCGNPAPCPPTILWTTMNKYGIVLGLQIHTYEQTKRTIFKVKLPFPSQVERQRSRSTSQGASALSTGWSPLQVLCCKPNSPFSHIFRIHYPNPFLGLQSLGSDSILPLGPSIVETSQGLEWTLNPSNSGKWTIRSYALRRMALIQGE